MTQQVVEDVRPEDLLVVVRFRPEDFEDAGVEHIPLEPVCTPTTRAGTRDLVLKTPNRTVGKFVGSCLFREIFQIKDNARPELREGTEEWEIECWHWDLRNQGRELDRKNEYIGQMPQEEYRYPNGTVVRARILVLERNCATVMQLVDEDGETFTLQFK